MALTHTMTFAYNDGAATISKTETFAINGREIAIDTQVNPTGSATTNAAVTCAFNRATLQTFFMVSDTACTVKTNTTAGTDSFTLVANQPVLCNTSMPGGGATKLFTADVTVLYVTTGATTTTLSIRGLETTP